MKKGINSFQIKIIAIILMFIDHIGSILFPHILIYRIIGRLAFPLFAFSISEGYRHTRSVPRYMLRLAVCAVLFQIPDWFFGIHYEFNIFATLFFGLSAITALEKLKDKSVVMSWIAASAIAVIAECTGADYKAYGVFLILTFYLTSGSVVKMVTGIAVLHAAYAAYEMTSSYISTGTAVFTHSLQLYSMLAIPIIALYNNERGRKMKYFFYLFYPLHLIVLYLIDLLIS